MPRTILITGASSGIGRAVALHYAAGGDRLALFGRDRSRLEAVAEQCHRLGADVSIDAVDVRDRTEMMARITAIDRTTPVDLLIANAGIMAGTPPGGSLEPAEAGYRVIETNIFGVFNSIQPLLGPMMARRKGQLAIVSSIAAFVPLPDAPSYCASKSAVLAYGLSLRSLLKPYGVRVSVICPGYVATPMMASESGPKPFVLKPERAANLIASGLASNRSVIAFPRTFALATRLHGVLPDGIRRWVSSKFRFSVRDET
jgi:short-subunit dehydrogenase